ncbi:unnamed protein product [Caenorhabditis nigoni]
MITISGKPGISNSSETLDVFWQNCMGRCWADINCSVVYKMSDIQCQYFRFGTISTIRNAASNEDEIALKIQASGNQCPASNPLVPGPNNFTQIINGHHYTTTVSRDSLSSNIYKLKYNIAVPTKTCPNNTKQFRRGKTTVVCIGLYFFETPLCDNYMQASALCKAKKGTLTGPANADEYKYIQDISLSSYSTSNPNSYHLLTYWIDGISPNTEYYTFEDPTHNGTTSYQWSKAAPNDIKAGRCLYNPNSVDPYTSADSCGLTICCDTMCWRGALCQVPQITVLKYL